jgi:hypothetical protein
MRSCVETRWQGWQQLLKISEGVVVTPTSVFLRKKVHTNKYTWMHGKKEESTMSKAATSATGHMLRIYRSFNLASSSDTVVACRLSTIIAAMVTLSWSAISCCYCCCGVVVVVVVESLVWQQTDGQIMGGDRWSNGKRSPCILLVVE